MSIGTRQYYDTYWSNDGFYPHGHVWPELAEKLGEYISVGMTCLDVGCGDGRGAGVWLRDRGCFYRGVDVSANAVRDARMLGLEAQVIDDAASLPFAENTFDAVVCIEVLEHLFLPQLAAVEMLRVLKPGGVLIATVPNVAYWRRRVELGLLGRWNPLGDSQSIEQPWRDPHIRFFNRGALTRMLEMAGYTTIRVGGHGGGFVRSSGPGRGKSLRVYRMFERVAPAIFGHRLDAVAFKPRESA